EPFVFSRPSIITNPPMTLRCAALLRVIIPLFWKRDAVSIPCVVVLVKVNVPEATVRAAPAPLLMYGRSQLIVLLRLAASLVKDPPLFLITPEVLFAPL